MIPIVSVCEGYDLMIFDMFSFVITYISPCMASPFFAWFLFVMFRSIIICHIIMTIVRLESAISQACDC